MLSISSQPSSTRRAFLITLQRLGSIISAALELSCRLVLTQLGNFGRAGHCLADIAVLAFHRQKAHSSVLVFRSDLYCPSLWSGSHHFGYFQGNFYGSWTMACGSLASCSAAESGIHPLIGSRNRLVSGRSELSPIRSTWRTAKGGR